MHNLLSDDIAVMKPALANMATFWEGKASVLELREANYNWRQMEWWAFYFELLCRHALADQFTIPGDSYGRIVFDAKRSANWDFKAKAIRSDDHRAILNDQMAMDASVAQYGEHGVLIALCDVEYNDVDRAFQAWHTVLKGGHSKYEKARIERTSISRYRKTQATLAEILFLRIDSSNREHLDIWQQGRNANGRPRAPKYMLNVERIEAFYIDRLVFNSSSPMSDNEQPITDG
ncbi:MAG: hypothetical protein ACYDAR_03565 [Thermomicrobiales bacterium]